MTQDVPILPFRQQNDLTRPMRNESGKQGTPDYISLRAGRGVTRARQMPAAELMKTLIVEIARAQLDRLAVRGAVAGMVPGIAIAMQRVLCRDAFFSDDFLQRRQPVRVIGLAGVGIAGGLRALDLGGECCCPFRPCEQPTIIQRQRHRESLRFPRLAEHRAVVIARDAGHGPGRRKNACAVRHYAFSR